MKKRNNRVFALLLAGTMMLGLAACGSAGTTEGSAVGSTEERVGAKRALRAARKKLQTQVVVRSEFPRKKSL